MNIDTPIKYMKEYCKKFNINSSGTKTNVYNRIVEFENSKAELTPNGVFKNNFHYLILDLETTGLNYNKHKIIEIAYIILDENLNEVYRNSSLIKVEPDLTDVYDKNLYNEAVNSNTTFNDFINNNLQIFECKIFVAHNVNFDKPFLLHNLQKLINAENNCAEKLKNLKQKLNNMSEYCTMKNFNDIQKRKEPQKIIKWTSLIDAYKHYFNVEFEDAHRAINDTIACMEVFKKLKNEK
jgi:DNA polymerase III alpha subunit (gram-positive type)